jgi:hypothetical protein
MFRVNQSQSLSQKFNRLLGLPTEAPRTEADLPTEAPAKQVKISYARPKRRRRLGRFASPATAAVRTTWY